MTYTQWRRDDLVPEQVARFVAKWARDRALPPESTETLVELTDDVVNWALGIGLDSLALELTWQDLDRVRANVRLQGTAPREVPMPGPSSDQARRLDALADDWASGHSPHEWWEWFTVNTSIDTPEAPNRRQAEADSPNTAWQPMLPTG
jgi:hypothetical protein